MKLSRLRRVGQAALQLTVRSVFRVLPTRLSFALVVYSRAFSLPGQTILTRSLFPWVARELVKNSNYRLNSDLTRRSVGTSAQLLYELRAFAEIIELLGRSSQVLSSRQAALALGMTYFEFGDFDLATEALAAWSSQSRLGDNYSLAEQVGYLQLIAGKPDRAAPMLEFAARNIPHLLRPHQNMAARYGSSYIPTALDLAAGRHGRLYDAYNFIGQRVTHVGRGELCAALYAGALRAQRALATDRPSLSQALQDFLAERELSLEALRLLPVEWVTQIGHLGMLDILFRMRQLGWWSGQASIVAPSKMIANQTFLELFDNEAQILVPDVTIPELLVPEFNSLQRYCGMSFNAFEMPGGEILPWQDAGAQAMREWDERGLEHPLAKRFDEQFGEVDTVQQIVADVKKKWGMQPGDWYVCLHMRDAAHYGETDGTGQTHRNSKAESYLDAIRYITEMGGWVIKLGGRGSIPLPNMPRVVDYALGKDKSELLDLHLIRHARFFIGTTSGLTNVAVSFGKHCALVNCITTDAQLWGDRIRFAPKTIRLADGGMVPQGALTVEPWRWRMFSAECLAQYGATALENTADEILETVKEVAALADGLTEDYEKTISDSSQLVERWYGSLTTRYFYGNARAGLYYVNKHRDQFLESPAT